MSPSAAPLLLDPVQEHVDNARVEDAAPPQKRVPPGGVREESVVGLRQCHVSRVTRTARVHDLADPAMLVVVRVHVARRFGEPGS